MDQGALQTTMGVLAEELPCEEDEDFFNNVVRLLDYLYPKDWRKWIVNVVTYEDLFGDTIASDMENRLRLAIPTVELARAHNSDETTLSERRYRNLKRILIKWPLGRALIYTPASIKAKIHPDPHHKKFCDVIQLLKPNLISRIEAEKLLRVNWNTVESTSVSSSSQAAKRAHSPEVGSSRSTKMPKLSELMARQDCMLDKLSQLANENKKILHTVTNASATNVMGPPLTLPPRKLSKDAKPSSSCDDNEESEFDYCVPPGLDTEDQIKKQDVEPVPGTAELLGEISKAGKEYLDLGIKWQKLNAKEWRNIGYQSQQKQFEASPVFTALKVNADLLLITPPREWLSALENMDSTLGAITHGLLQQRQAFHDFYQDAAPEVKSAIGEVLLSEDSKFRQTSDALLQYVCGKRAEVIEQRRSIYRPTNGVHKELLHAIPPSGEHLFAEPQLTEFVKSVGGVAKLFRGKLVNRVLADVQSDV